MKVEIDLRKNIKENAADFYEKSKTARKKLAGVIKAIEESEKKIKELNEEKPEEKTIKKKRKKKWFEKFHWGYTSKNHLVIGGRDTQSNEMVVKKHMDKGDLYFHAEVYGAPHCILKTENNKADETSLIEAAQFAAIFSKAWKDKQAFADVYSVLPSQVSKKAPSGEALGSGAFMIYGQRKWFRKTPLKFGIGVQEENGDNIVISGPFSAVKKHAKHCIEIIQGEESKSDTAKKIKKEIEKKIKSKIDLDEILRMLPTGGCKINKIN